MKISRSKVESIVIFFFPFYLRSSGQPQLFDLLMLVLIISYLPSQNFKIKKNMANVLLISLFFIISLTSLIRSIEYSNMVFIKYNIFYLYNFFVYFYFENRISRYGNEDFKYLQKTLFFTSLIVTAVTIIDFSVNSQVRAVGPFNNPNQLSYFSLIHSILVFVVAYQIESYGFSFYLALLFNTIMNILSLSNAGIISQLVLLCLVIFIFLKNKRVKLSKIVYVLIVSIIIIMFFFKKTNLYYSFIMRMQKTSNKLSDSGSVRGYSRIIENPQYLLLGSGEGINLRMGATHEFHSTLGNLSLSYGIISLILFILFRLKSTTGLARLLSLPILMYGLTHNGIRFTIVWITYAHLSNLNMRRNYEKKN